MGQAGAERRSWRLVCAMIQIVVAVGTNTTASHHEATWQAENPWPQDELMRRLVKDFVVHLNIDYLNFIIEGLCASLPSPCWGGGV